MFTLMVPIRTLIQNYGSCCERLLSAGEGEPLSDEETEFIQYYITEMEKKFDGCQP